MHSIHLEIFVLDAAAALRRQLTDLWKVLEKIASLFIEAHKRVKLGQPSKASGTL